MNDFELTSLTHYSYYLQPFVNRHRANSPNGKQRSFLRPAQACPSGGRPEGAGGLSDTNNQENQSLGNRPRQPSKSLTEQNQGLDAHVSEDFTDLTRRQKSNSLIFRHWHSGCALSLRAILPKRDGSETLLK